MTELPKENVIFICNKCRSIMRNGDKIENCFSELTTLLEKDYGIILAFTEMIGNRCKFICGSSDFVTPVYKYSNGEYGIMIQDWGIFAEEKKEIVDTILDCIQ